MRIAVRADQIHHLHLLPTHLPQQITDQRMQRGDFQLRRLGKSQRGNKKYLQKSFRVHSDKMKRFFTNASFLR